jgi:multiple sugar transport system ATP-binding protein
MTAARLQLTDLTKRFDALTAVDALSLDVRAGEFVVLVGPSGSGKSTVLRLVAGLEVPTAGTITIGERDVTRVSPRDRDVAMIFQDYALYPHMTCAQNIGYGLKVRGMPKAQIRERVVRAARTLGLEDLLARRPATLSGGQRQRVAMGRAIARDPAIFLMDEPLSNLDARLRTYMRTELRALQERLGVTTVFVTHDQVEAMTMGDRVAVLRAGRLQQLDTPTALYERPANVFVAGFIGTPAMNFVLADAAGGTTTLGGDPIGVPAPAGAPARLILGIRPEGITIGGPDPTLQGRVRLVEMLGNEVIAHLEVPAEAPRLPELDEVAMTDDPLATTNNLTALVARVPTGIPLAVGALVPLSIDGNGTHLFDPVTHAAQARPG